MDQPSDPGRSFQIPAAPYVDPYALWSAPLQVQLPVAPLGRIIVAYLIDAVLEMIFLGVPIVVIGLWLAIELFSSRPGRRPEIPGIAVLVVAGVVLSILGILYRPVCETRWGKTIGKAVMNLRVVMEDGRPCTGTAAVLRYLLFVVD